MVQMIHICLHVSSHVRMTLCSYACAFEVRGEIALKLWDKIAICESLLCNATEDVGVFADPSIEDAGILQVSAVFL